MQLPTLSSLLLPAAICPLVVTAISLDITSSASIKNASGIVAKDMLSYYNGSDPGQVPGLFGLHNYWWLAGAVWGSLIDYWNYTGDTQYVSLVQQALLFQVGPGNDYMVPNQTKIEGNSDQATWALAAMRAAELRFPNPSTSPSWLDLAINVFNDQVGRWDTKHCGGGLRWQIFTFNDGYNYKDALSNGLFFQLAARLARYTGNQTYADWATKSYAWTSSVGLIDDDYRVFDGTFVDDDCSRVNRVQWTAAVGAFMYGSAVMTNFTNTNSTWKDRTDNLLSAMSVFFKADNDTRNNDADPGIMYEVACEPQGNCDTEQAPYKGLTAQWMGETTQVAPFTTKKILGYIQSSARGAGQQCSGGPNGTTCGTRWTESKYDGQTGLGQEFSAFNVFLANLALNTPAPIDANTTVAKQESGTAQADSLTSANGSTQSPTSTGTSRTPTATPSSASQLLWTASSSLSLIVSAAALALSFL